MQRSIIRRVIRPAATAALALALLVSPGCASPQQMAKGIVDTGFDVTKFVVTETAKISLTTTEKAVKGTMNAVMK